jgi:hypothetical protein
MPERAVSDTIGFVLVFGLIVATVAVVYVGGFEALTAARESQQLSNTERAFDVLDANIEDLAIRGAPRRTTELRLAEGSLSFGSAVTFNVTAGGENFYAATIRPIVYEADNGDRIVYANGAAFRDYGDRAVMFDTPRVANGSRAFLPLVVTRAQSANVSTFDSRRLLVRTTVNGREVREFDTTGVELVVTSPRAGAWERYLEDELDANCAGPADGVSGSVTCPLDADSVYVQAIGVNVAFT